VIGANLCLFAFRNETFGARNWKKFRIEQERVEKGVLVYLRKDGVAAEFSEPIG
jgi:hypothetical protein